MSISLYPKDDGIGFTAEEIRRGEHTVHMDWKCPNCKKEQSYATYMSNWGCFKCGHK